MAFRLCTLSYATFSAKPCKEGNASQVGGLKGRGIYKELNIMQYMTKHYSQTGMDVTLMGFQ